MTFQSNKTLLLIPCCAAKSPMGVLEQCKADSLFEQCSLNAYNNLYKTRNDVLQSIRTQNKFLIDKYEKNNLIVEGFDNGGALPGLYKPALDRYIGKLYSVPLLKESIKECLSKEAGPKILILSALYGPLHPYSPIQDYNLMMSDKPALLWGSGFSIFLQDYVKHNAIEQVVLYFGSGTAYFKVAKKAVEHLRNYRLIKKAIQYHVLNGCTAVTPVQHGLRLVDDLTGSKCSSGIIENIL